MMHIMFHCNPIVPRTRFQLNYIKDVVKVVYNVPATLKNTILTRLMNTQRTFQQEIRIISHGKPGHRAEGLHPLKTSTSLKASDL